jgi:ribosomal protein S27E
MVLNSSLRLGEYAQLAERLGGDRLPEAVPCKVCGVGLAVLGNDAGFVSGSCEWKVTYHGPDGREYDHRVPSSHATVSNLPVKARQGMGKLTVRCPRCGATQTVYGPRKADTR